MTLAQPFSLRIFVADGDPDGLRLVERSNWIGKALVFPRKLYPEVRNRAEFQQTGVYLLLDGEGEKIYIGEFTPRAGRPVEFLEGPDCVNRVVFFTACGGQLNPAHAQFLASRLVRLAKKAKKVKLKGCDEVPEPMLSVADCAEMEAFLQKMLVVLPAAGVGLFEEVRSKAVETSASERSVVDVQSTSDAAKKREEQEQAAKMEKFIRSLLKPSKRNLGVASCMGIALVLIQCARAGYLPEFDWKSGAGAVAVVAVLAVSIFAMFALALVMALPALPQVKKAKGRVPDRHIGALITAFFWTAVCFGGVAFSQNFRLLNGFFNSAWGAVALLVLVLFPVFGFPPILAKRELSPGGSVFSKEYARLVGAYYPWITLIPAAYYAPYCVLVNCCGGDSVLLAYTAFLPAIVGLLLNLIVLVSSRTPAMCVTVAVFIFVVFAWPASDGAFSLLGLGGRTIEFYLAKPEYRDALALVHIEPDPVHREKARSTDDLYQVYLRLRLGSELVVSAERESWGREANVVAIPRDAIRGLRFVPPSPKSVDGTKVVQNPAPGDKSAQPTPKQSP